MLPADMCTYQIYYLVCKLGLNNSSCSTRMVNNNSVPVLACHETLIFLPYSTIARSLDVSLVTVSHWESPSDCGPGSESLEGLEAMAKLDCNRHILLMRASVAGCKLEQT